MQELTDVKDLVKEKYGEIAGQSRTQNLSSCCGSGCCSTEVYNLMADDYAGLEGYHAAADLGLGCGLPTEFAQIKKGNTVIDLGSGAGNDCFVARSLTGPEGHVIGIDFTPAMLEQAKKNTAKLGYDNVSFIEGDIERIPLPRETADVVISNCVLNLVPDKQKVLQEIFRVLKTGGHFSISDIVLEGSLPDALRKAAEMYAGCISGAIQKQVYLELIEATGFTDITIQKEKEIFLPDDILSNYADAATIQAFRNSGTGIYSITVFAAKPEQSGKCCGDGCCS